MRNIILVLFLSGAALAQQPEHDYRWYFQQGEEAAKQKDHAAAISNYEKALELNTKPPNRPWYMYLLARQHALSGHSAESVKWLERLWDDGVESLMISNVEFDPAFTEARKSPGYAALMKRVAKMQVTMRPLSGNVQSIDGAGCWLVASIGPDGVLLVDSGYEPASAAIAAVMRKQPRFIINTHAHDDHVGGNKALGRSATIVGHASLRTELTRAHPLIEGEVNIPARGPEFLPNVTVDQGPLTIHFNGENVRVVPLPSHSSSDVVVFFESSQVLHMGDNYFPKANGYLYPGESMNAYFAALDPVVAQLSDDAWVVTGHEPPVRGRDLKASYGATKEMRDFVQQEIAAGHDAETTQMNGVAKGYRAGWMKYFYEQIAPKR